MKNEYLNAVKTEAAEAYKMALRLSVLPEDAKLMNEWIAYANEMMTVASAIERATYAEFYQWLYAESQPAVNQPVQLSLL